MGGSTKLVFNTAPSTNARSLFLQGTHTLVLHYLLSTSIRGPGLICSTILVIWLVVTD